MTLNVVKGIAILVDKEIRLMKTPGKQMDQHLIFSPPLSLALFINQRFEFQREPQINGIAFFIHHSTYVFSLAMALIFYYYDSNLYH
jgi:hypothetical protein